MNWDLYYKLEEEKYERFMSTLIECGEFLLDASDEEIETCIFEDFCLDVRSFMSDQILEQFMYNGWIDEEIKEKSQKLRELLVDIEINSKELWNIQSVRTSACWRELMELSDKIKTLLYF